MAFIGQSRAWEWGRRAWEFYQAYSQTAVHTAATAGLAIFGVLVVVDWRFAILAVISYLGPPLVLSILMWAAPSRGLESVTDKETGAGHEQQETVMEREVSPSEAEKGSLTDGNVGLDSDTDNGGTDSDTDSDDGDTDSDTDSN